MFTQSKLLVQLSKQNIKTFATIKGGNLYTWGSYSSGTGFNLHNQDKNVNVPKRVDAFDGNVQKVVMGPYHTAIITTEGELYTMGCGNYGALGQNSASEIQDEPSRVEFFASNNLKVRDAALGEHHTVVTTENGDVYTFGFGGSWGYGALDWALPRTGALGNGSINHSAEPQLVEGVSNVQSLSSGDNFVIAVTKDGKVFNWGDGKDGSLADGVCEGVLSPQVNENFQLLQEKEKLTIKQIKSASHFSVALMSDGNLYAWGRNSEGSLGIRQNIGHKTDQIATLPTKVVNQYFDGQKIVDYAVGENTLVVLTDQNQVFWSGMDLAYKPVQWELPADEKISKVAASKDSFAALTTSGRLLTFNDFVNRDVTQHRQGREYFVAGSDLFENKKIAEVGGSYGIRYAIAN